MDFFSSSPFLFFLFFLIAFLYSSVGLGGGSSYTAILTILGIDYIAIPSITLLLNLFVTTIGSFNFIRQKHLRLTLFLPFFLSSIPMSYLGGSLHIGKNLFYWILCICLVFVAIRIYFLKTVQLTLILSDFQKITFSVFIGAVLGFMAGVAGLGGGIFLVPFIIILGLGSAKEAAACGSLFIWANSLSGLIARSQYNAIDIARFSPIIAAVILGGFAGSHFGSTKFSSKTLEKILGSIILIAIFLLSRKLHW